MGDIAYQTPTRTISGDITLLLHHNQTMEAEIKRLREELKMVGSTVYQQRKTISEQAKTIRELNKKVIKFLEAAKEELNKDKFTFIQAFRLRCKEKSILSKLKEFLKEEPTWDNLTTDKLLQFNKWIRTSAGIKDSTACTYVTLLKGVIKYGYANSKDASVALKSVRPAKSKKVWLRPDDICSIMQYDPTDKDEEYVRKMFLICALTGCRIIDAPNLRKENIDGNTLRYIPIKTKNQECFVPLSEKVKWILLDLFNLEVLPTKKDINKILKNICRKCGITRKFDTGTPNNPDVVELWEAITFHTARRSYATIMFRYSDMSERQLANAMGHSSFSQTWDSYIADKSNVSVEEKTLYKDQLFY